MSPLLYTGVLLLLIPLLLITCGCVTVILGSLMPEFRSDNSPSYIGYVYALLGIVILGVTLVGVSI